MLLKCSISQPRLKSSLLFFIPHREYSSARMRCFMTDISDAINYYSLHLINNYCFCSFLLAMSCAVIRKNVSATLTSHSTITLALLFYSSFLAPQTSSYFYVVGNFFNVHWNHCNWMLNVRRFERTNDADKCIQEIILKTFIKRLFIIRCFWIFTAQVLSLQAIIISFSLILQSE